jgi:hypothetical protein
MPVYYTVDGRDPRPVPGNFFGQLTATDREDAVKKAKSSKLRVPGTAPPNYADVNSNGVKGYFVRYQTDGSADSGGKRRKTRRGRKTRRNKTRRSRRK